MRWPNGCAPLAGAAAPLPRWLRASPCPRRRCALWFVGAAPAAAKQGGHLNVLRLSNLSRRRGVLWPLPPRRVLRGAARRGGRTLCGSPAKSVLPGASAPTCSSRRRRGKNMPPIRALWSGSCAG